jgi:acyl-CoA thioester hydrolase
MRLSRYFKPSGPLADGSPAPPPLAVETARVVRFNEVDPLNVVWHGHYASYFEDARLAFGERYGLSYQAMYAAGFATPIKRLHVDYEAPLRFNQECGITAVLFWNDAARLDFEYLIRDMQGRVLTRGYTVQLFVSLGGELSYAKPDFYEAFCQRWQKGLLFRPAQSTCPGPG